MSFKIHVVDDNLFSLKKISYILKMNPDHEVVAFDDPHELLKSIDETVDLACLDYLMSSMDGMDLAQKILNKKSNQDIFIISGQEEISKAVELVKSGVTDYIIKNDYLKENLLKAVDRLKEKKELRNEIDSLKSKLSKFEKKNPIIGGSNESKRIEGLILKAAKTNINIFIYGETGTGKELVAKSIADKFNGKNDNFTSLNMSAMPTDILESELFGHEKGAFTGADKKKIGLFEKANNGVLFLDEIAEMPISLQPKLLRALQERTIRRVGGLKEIPIRFKLISATNKNLLKEIQQGSFREDLYYRLAGFPIELKPLREKMEDLEVLANYFIKEFSLENSIKAPVLSNAALKKLKEYDYPGNIRELKSIIELAFVMSENQLIEPEDITSGNQMKRTSKLDKSLEDYTNEIIQDHLKKYDYNIKKVAQILDIGVSTIYYLAKRNKIDIKR